MLSDNFASKREGVMMKVVFLDIDGVLFPCRGRKFKSCNAGKVKKELCDRNYGLFHDINEYDLTMAYTGWKPEAIIRLKILLDKCGAKIVISSSWKFTRSVRELKQLFGIYGLEEYVADKTTDNYGFLKVPAIQGYLKDHPKITSYVVLDDIDMCKDFPYHMVVCPDVFDEKCLENAIKILK